VVGRTRATLEETIGDPAFGRAVVAEGDLTPSAPGESLRDRDARAAQQNPAGRIARLDEITEATLYLASDAAAYCVGTDLRIDGGAAA